MKDYNGFTPAQRNEGDRIIKKAIADGILPPPTKCRICGQTEGIMHYHAENYEPDKILKSCRSLCWRCHLVFHSRFRAPEQAKKYFKEVLSGKKYPPVYKHNFYVLKRDHGIQ